MIGVIFFFSFGGGGVKNLALFFRYFASNREENFVTYRGWGEGFYPGHFSYVGRTTKFIHRHYVSFDFFFFTRVSN